MIKSLTKLSFDVARKIQDTFPQIPEEYLQFLRNIGWGRVSHSLMLYSGPVTPDEIYLDNYQNTNEVIIFGDDFNGHCFGWNTENSYSVVDIDPIDFSIEELDLSFQVFVASRTT